MIKYHIDLKQIMSFVTRNRLLRLLRWSNKSSLLGALIITLTNKCNMKCYMCGIGRKIAHGNKYEIKEIGFDVLKRVIDEVSEFKFFKPRLHFTGGEPLLYRNFMELISYCKEKKIKWSVTTNGYILDRYYKQIVDNNCDKINISIHGFERVHDDIVGIDGCFSKVNANLDILNEYKNSKNTHFALPAVNCVISRKNVKELKKILNRLSSLPIHSITFQHLIFSKKDLEVTNGDVPRDKQEIDALKEFMKYVRDNDFGLPVQFFPRIKEKDIYHYYTDYTYPFKKSCILPWLVLRIRSDGGCRTCHGVELGNIKNDTIREIWNNCKNVEFRKRLRRFGIFDYCQRCCHRQYY